MGNKKLKSIDLALKKPKITLEEVLEYESIIYKAKAGDLTLIQFLSSRDHILTMIHMIIAEYDSAEKALKFPFVCCELLIILTATLNDFVTTDPLILEEIWLFLREKQRIDPQTFAYITRILGDFNVQILAVLRERVEIIDLFLNHLDNTPSADFLSRLIEIDSASFKILQLLDDVDFFAKLMVMIRASEPEAKQFALFHFINGLIMRKFPENYSTTALLHRFTNPSIFEPFLTEITQPETSTSSYYQGINIISVLCAKIYQVAEFGTPVANLVAELAKCLIPYLKFYANALESTKEWYNGPGGPTPRLGVYLIKASRLFSDLALLKSPLIIDELKSLQVAEKLFSLFFAHPQKTLLHNNVIDFFAYLCQGDWSTNRSIIIDNILRGSKLLSRITQSQRLADCLCEMPRQPRPNFMGHVTIIADQVHALLDKHGAELYKEIGDLLRRETWIEYSNKSYRETKLKDALILGGEQPPIHAIPSEDVFTSVFTSSADETIVRYFCHEIIANFPPNLQLGDIDEVSFSDEEESIEEAIDMVLSNSSIGILNGTLLSNRGGFENIIDLEMELRMSTLDDDDFDLGPDSEDENLFADHDMYSS